MSACTHDQTYECRECGEWVCEDCAGDVDHDGEYYEGRLVGHTTVWCADCRPKGVSK